MRVVLRGIGWLPSGLPVTRGLGGRGPVEVQLKPSIAPISHSSRNGFRGFHLKADPYRRPQRGPVTNVNLPRGLRVGESLDDPLRTLSVLVLSG